MMHSPTNLIRSCCFLALAASPLALAPAMADPQYGAEAEQQQQQHDQYGGYEQPAAVDHDEETLDKFADAFVKVQTIQTSASQEMEQVTDPTQAQDIQQRVQEEMVQAVIDKGLSVEEYNQIAQQMNTDVDLRENVMSRLEERLGS